VQLSKKTCGSKLFFFIKMISFCRCGDFLIYQIIDSFHRFSAFQLCNGIPCRLPQPKIKKYSKVIASRELHRTKRVAALKVTWRDMTGHDKEPSFRFVIRLYTKPLHEIQVQFIFLRIFAENIHNRNFTPCYKRLRKIDVPYIDDMDSRRLPVYFCESQLVIWSSFTEI
jgi:hypothetical protein